MQQGLAGQLALVFLLGSRDVLQKIDSNPCRYRGLAYSHYVVCEVLSIFLLQERQNGPCQGGFC